MLFNIYLFLAFVVIVALSVFIVFRVWHYEAKIQKLRELVDTLQKGIVPEELRGASQAGVGAGQPHRVAIMPADRDDLLRRMLYAASKPDPYMGAKGIVDTLLQYGGFNLDNASLFLYNKKRKTMRLLYSNVGNQYEKSVQGYVNDLNKQMAEKGKKGYTLYTDEDSTLNYVTADQRQIKYMFYIPIYRGDLLLGALMVESRHSDCRKTLSLNFFKLAVENISLVLSNIVLMKQVIATSHTDALSGAYTRTHLDFFIKPLVRAGTQVTLIMADIDHFKAVNDTYGHLTGDMVIKTVVQAMKEAIRDDEDGVFRFGGEEFLVVFLSPNIDLAMIRAEKIRKRLEKTRIISEDGRDFRITISMGVARMDGMRGLSSSISDADKALYYSKEHGRNRVTLYDNIAEEISNTDGADGELRTVRAEPKAVVEE